ncbi:MAG TPA: NAD(P)H-quinone oxidoreductase [Gemmatimonadaceae bacterium]|jgi:putative PIG3 family NAD(P)H quinone oxidoreductase
MRAAYIARFGEPNGLEIRDVPEPQVPARHVLVRVRAAGLNRADLMQRAGKYPPPADVPKEIPGLEFAGEVVRCGDGASRWREGDRVFAITGGGAQAEYVSSHEDMLASVPGRLSDVEAGAVPEAYITAYDALIGQAGLKAGERVLIHAVASGVGLAAVQICRAWGAIPYGTSRTEAKLDRARSIGLEAGVALGSDPGAILARGAAWTGGVGFDVVLDLVGGDYVSPSLEVLAPRGRLMLVGTMAGSRANVDLRRILGMRLTLRGTVLRGRSLQEKIAAMRAFTDEVVPRLANGTLAPVIDATYPLAQIDAAYARLESNSTVGKVVLTI